MEQALTKKFVKLNPKGQIYNELTKTTIKGAILHYFADFTKKNR